MGRSDSRFLKSGQLHRCKMPFRLDCVLMAELWCERTHTAGATRYANELKLWNKLTDWLSSMMEVMKCVQLAGSEVRRGGRYLSQHLCGAFCVCSVEWVVTGERVKGCKTKSKEVWSAWRWWRETERRGMKTERKDAGKGANSIKLPTAVRLLLLPVPSIVLLPTLMAILRDF